MAKIKIERNDAMERIKAIINDKGEVKEPSENSIITCFSEEEYNSRKNYGRKHYAN